MTIIKELDKLLAKHARHQGSGNPHRLIKITFSLTVFIAVLGVVRMPTIHCERLLFKDGMIHQYLTINSPFPVTGTWAAEFVRQGKIICRGSGIAPYEPRATGEARRFTPDEWTHDTCPAIRPGDQAIATWTWRNALGFEQSTGMQITIR